MDEEADEAELFSQEVGATVRRAVELGHTVDNLALEVNSLKFAQNRTFADCVRAIVPALLEDVAQAPSKKAKVGAIKKLVERWAPLLLKFVQSKKDQRALVEAVVESCELHPPLVEVFDFILKLLCAPRSRAPAHLPPGSPARSARVRRVRRRAHRC